jgi:hypothetical protein
MLAAAKWRVEYQLNAERNFCGIGVKRQHGTSVLYGEPGRTFSRIRKRARFTLECGATRNPSAGAVVLISGLWFLSVSK